MRLRNVTMTALFVLLFAGLAGCAGQKPISELELDLQQAMKRYPDVEASDKMEPDAYLAMLMQYRLEDFLEPINAKYSLFEARLEHNFPDRDGVVFRLTDYCPVDSIKNKNGDVVCVSEKGRRSESYRMVTVTESRGAAVTRGLRREDMFELVTDDPKLGGVKQIYLFGDPRFDLYFLTAFATKTSLNRVWIENPGPKLLTAQGRQELETAYQAGSLLTNILSLLKEAATGGGALVQTVLTKLVSAGGA